MPRVKREPRVPDGPDLTHSQRQIWVGQRLTPESPLYNMTFAFVFSTEIDPDLFREAWRRVVQGSDALRTRIVEAAGGLQRRVDEPGVSPSVIAIRSAQSSLLYSGASSQVLQRSWAPQPLPW